ncbi:MAG TPA: cytidylate kinase-like family protein [Syntrophales bacterium]|nr:cytidylate kinase-like family protein [Syntrophobacterales bacterium]HQL89107.1 cytidylate kinase-like family protein [Syntrophales bacterium]
MDRKVCSICAWREHCQKRFQVATDPMFNVNCPDYTRDVQIKDSEIEAKIVQEQMEKWQREKARENAFTITISRQAGAGGSEIARVLAKKTKMDLMAGQIIQHVAESSKMSTKVVETLDEKAITTMESWINSMFVSRHLWPSDYLKHLTRVIATIGRHGNAIIVGRGAGYILPPETTFRVKIIAPLEYRIQSMMRIRNLSRAEAQSYIEKRDGDRIAFVKKYFQADAMDPLNYDLVINTEKVGIEGAVDTILIAFRDWTKGIEEKSPKSAKRAKAH